MSQPSSVETDIDTPKIEAVQKQKPSIFTVMLILSFLAIAMASLLLYLEARQWGSYPWWKPGTSTTTSYLFESAAPQLLRSVPATESPVELWA